MSDLKTLQDFASHNVADRRTINGNLSGARNATMLGLIGNPCGVYTNYCQSPTNPAIAAMIVSQDLGPFKAQGLRPAVQALQTILRDIRASHPDIHAALGTVGMLCCRLVRGSATAISNHSWGTAIDLTIGGSLDPRGDELAQSALFDIHPIFNRHGFFWGAAYGTEDAMHFEASEQLIRRWAAAGAFGPIAKGIPAGLTTGDRGPKVEALQAALNTALSPVVINVDGIYGKDTRAAVVEFQCRQGIAANGIASRAVLKLLKID